MAGKYNIIIIEDNETFALLITHYLKNNLPHANVYIENSGSKAIQSIKRLNPQIVVLDYYLEEQLSAKDVLKVIHEMVRPSRVILFSSIEDETELQQVMQMGVHSFLPKANESIYLLLKTIQGIIEDIETDDNIRTGGKNKTNNFILGLIGVAIIVIALVLILLSQMD